VEKITGLVSIGSGKVIQPQEVQFLHRERDGVSPPPGSPS
jgi:hypothetical protein